MTCGEIWKLIGMMTLGYYALGIFLAVAVIIYFLFHWKDFLR